MAINIKFGVNTGLLGGAALESGRIMQMLRDASRRGGRGGGGGRRSRGVRIKEPSQGGHFHGDTFVDGPHTEGDVQTGRTQFGAGNPRDPEFAQQEQDRLQAERAELTNDALRIQNDSNLNELEKQQGLDQLQQQGRAFQNNPSVSQMQAQNLKQFQSSIWQDPDTGKTMQFNPKTGMAEFIEPPKDQGGFDPKDISKAIAAAQTRLNITDLDDTPPTQDEIMAEAERDIRMQQALALRLSGEGGGVSVQDNALADEAERNMIESVFGSVNPLSTVSPDTITNETINSQAFNSGVTDTGALNEIAPDGNIQFDDRETGAPLDSIIAPPDTTPTPKKAKKGKKAKAEDITATAKEQAELTSIVERIRFFGGTQEEINNAVAKFEEDLIENRKKVKAKLPDQKFILDNLR